MKLVFMGPPGAGKGTQAGILCDSLSIPQISTGDILRKAMKNGTPMGQKAKEYVESGKLVPDEVVIGIVKDRIADDDCKNGFLLDGFPRTTEQADALEALLKENGTALDAAVNLDVPEAELVKRLLDRAQKEGRSDDTEPVIKQRLQTYAEKTQPLIDYYRNKGLLKEVNGLGSLEEITERIRTSLSLS